MLANGVTSHGVDKPQIDGSLLPMISRDKTFLYDLLQDLIVDARRCCLSFLCPLLNLDARARYVHGKSLKDSPSAFEGPVEQAATAAALGRVLVLDLVLRNEDRLAVKRLGWQENAGNLRYTERLFTTPKTPAQLATEVTAAADLVRVKSKGRAKARSAENKLRPAVVSGAGGSSPSSVILHKRSMSAPNVREIQEASILDPLAVPAPGPSARGSVVVIDSGIPRRPPAAKMEADRENFPKLMELLLCDVDVAAEVLREVSSGYLPATSPSTDGATAGPEEEPHGGAQAEDVPSLLSSDPSQAVELSSVDQAAAERRLVEAFQRGVRETVEAVHGLRPLLSRLHQRLDGLLRAFIACIGEVGRAEQRPSPGAPRRLSGAGLGHSPSARKPPSPKDPKKPLSPKDPRKPPSPRDTKLPTPPSAVRTFNRAGSGSPGENGREPGSPLRGSPLRFTIRLKDWQKVAKVRGEGRQGDCCDVCCNELGSPMQ